MNATNNQHNYFNKNDRTHVSRRSCYVFFHINVPLLQLKTQCNDRVWDFLNKSPARLCSPVPDTQVRSSWKWIQIEPETPTFHTSALFRQNFKCLAKSEFSFVCWASQQRKLGGAQQRSGESSNDIWWVWRCRETSLITCQQTEARAAGVVEPRPQCHYTHTGRPNTHPNLG